MIGILTIRHVVAINSFFQPSWSSGSNSCKNMCVTSVVDVITVVTHTVVHLLRSTAPIDITIITRI